MDEDPEEGVELTEDVVLELGNQILSVLGADEPITDIETFCTDALYIQLFKALFPHLPLDELQPGETEEEVAENLRTLRGLLGESILETDLSYISATAIMSGDLTHLAEFLQILMQVIALLAEGEGEGDDMGASQRKSEQSRVDHNFESDDENKTDTQKIKAGLGLSSPENEGEEDEYDYEDQLMQQIDQNDRHFRDEQIEDDEPVRNVSQPSPPYDDSPDSNRDSPMKSDSKKKQKLDVLNDPLLPEDVDMRKSSGKKRKRAGSFGDNNRDNFDDDEDDNQAIVFDELPPEEKLAVIQQLYEEYNRDPDSFPEEQRILLEEELKNMIDQGLIDGIEGEGEGEENESELDDRMMAKGEINFPKDPLPVKREDDDKAISKGERELDVQEVERKKIEHKYHEESGNIALVYNLDQSEHNEEYQDEDLSQHEEPDEEAQIISKGKYDQRDQQIEHYQQEKTQIDGTETPDIDDEMKLAMLQRMQQEQAAISRRIIRRKKSKKKKKVRPETASKYAHGTMNRSKYARPWTAKAVKPLKKKTKTIKKRNPRDLYLEQLRQQQMLQQLALEQQNLNQEEEQPEGEGDIQITPEQALLLYQQLAERQQSGEELTEEEFEQLQFLGQLLEQNFAIQNQQEEDRAIYYPSRTKTKRKSKMKGKKTTKKPKQQVDEQTLLMMLQNQRNMQHMQNMQQKQNIGLPYGVDEIKEVDEEETPIRELQDRKYKNYGQEEYDNSESKPGVHETDIPYQINAQVPAHFGNNEEEKMNYSPQMNQNDQNLQMLQNLTPEQIYQLQQMQNQQQYYNPQQTEINSKYAEDQTNNMGLLKAIMDIGQQNGVVKKDLLSILPLSQSVANAKKQFKSMNKYELDVYDKKRRSELSVAKAAPDSEHYFQEILRQSLENAMTNHGITKNIPMSKFVVPLLKYCKKNGLKSFEVSV